MRRLPIVPTITVLLAVAAMLGLGVWQLNRARWKEGLIARYAANAHLPEIEFPRARPVDETLLYRRARGFCTAPVSWITRAGHSADGRTGWRHIAACGSGLVVDLGWSTRSDAPEGYRGGAVTGTLDRDAVRGFLLVAERPAPGLLPSAQPSPAEMPNNHRSYAVQWFLFASAALVIYGLALRQKLARTRRDG